MNADPKEFVVYWISKTARKRGSYNDKYRANMKTFNELEKAQAHCEKLQKMIGTQETHMQRYIHHVSYVYKVDRPE